MDKKKILAQLTILSMLFIGCSNISIEQDNNPVSQEAIKEQTMTKVQNNTSEIIGKDQVYVLENLGEANVATYWVDIDNIDKINNIEDAKKLSNLDLFYFKDICGDYDQNTALFLSLGNGIVNDVQSIDYIKTEYLDDNYESKAVFNIYKDYDELDLDLVNNIDLKDFQGLKYGDYEGLIGTSKYMYDAYMYDEVGRGLEIFPIRNSENALCIFTKGDIVQSARIIKPENAYDIKHLILEGTK